MLHRLEQEGENGDHRRRTYLQGRKEHLTSEGAIKGILGRRGIMNRFQLPGESVLAHRSELLGTQLPLYSEGDIRLRKVLVRKARQGTSQFRAGAQAHVGRSFHVSQFFGFARQISFVCKFRLFFFCHCVQSFPLSGMGAVGSCPSDFLFSARPGFAAIANSPMAIIV